MRIFTILLLLIYSNLCLALGLSEVELKSHLGEDLHVSIDVTDLDSNAESSCFSVSDTSDIPAFKKVNLSLKPSSTGHQLTITSNDVVSEPIVNLHVSFQCEPNLSREYILLLDPALPASVNRDVVEENMNVEPVTKVLEANSQGHNVPDQITEKYSGDDIVDQPIVTKPTKKKKERKIVSAYNSLTEPVPEKKQKFKVESVPKLSVEPKMSAVPEVVSDSTRVPEVKVSPVPAKTNTVASKPFLTISGGSENSSELNISKPSAANETSVRADAVITPPSATDIMDEVAVMTNRMAQLEKQIVSLQNSNAQLEAAAALTRVENSRFNWQQILQIALVIITALFSVEWMRHRAFNRSASAAVPSNSLKIKRNSESTFDDFD